MKVLFLDIDGVLNDHAFLIEADTGRAEETVVEWRPVSHIDAAKVAELNRVIDATGAKVVLSSSWRKIYPLAEMREILKSRGFTGALIGKTPSCSGSGRHREIKRWLEEQFRPVEAFAIVDDDEDAGYGLERHFVRTTFQPRGGLTAEHADKLIRILGEASHEAKVEAER
ncbi:MAG: hypothetical protein HOW73_20185 [Polyangiaceae bacterium]|nr:hypothetical protein [Polyangiaceae bacterium]